MKTSKMFWWKRDEEDLVHIRRLSQGDYSVCGYIRQHFNKLNALWPERMKAFDDPAIESITFRMENVL